MTPEDDRDRPICYFLSKRQKPETIAILLSRTVEDVKRLIAAEAKRRADSGLADPEPDNDRD